MIKKSFTVNWQKSSDFLQIWVGRKGFEVLYNYWPRWHGVEGARYHHEQDHDLLVGVHLDQISTFRLLFRGIYKTIFKGHFWCIVRDKFGILPPKVMSRRPQGFGPTGESTIQPPSWWSLLDSELFSYLHIPIWHLAKKNPSDGCACKIVLSKMSCVQKKWKFHPKLDVFSELLVIGLFLSVLV